MNYLHQSPAIKKSLAHLLRHDPVFSCHAFDLNEFRWERFAPGFEGLARIVAGQQVSTVAAKTIWGRVQKGLGHVTPDAILDADPETLRGFGLSRQKVTTIQGLAKAIRAGVFDPARMEGLPNNEVARAITAMKGFGPWSAQMFLMFALARPDVWAPADLGVQGGMRYYLSLPERPGYDRIREEEGRFAPHQTAACLLLWHVNGRGGLP